MRILQVITSLQTGGAEKLLVEFVPRISLEGVIVHVLTLNDDRTPFRVDLENVKNVKVRGLTNKSVYNPFIVFKIIPHLKKYDLIHVHLFPALYWVVLAKWLSFSSCKVLYTEHSTNNKRRNNKILKLIDRFIYRGVHRIITISDEVDRNIKEHLKFKEINFVKISNGIDVLKFDRALPHKKNTFFDSQDFILIQVSSFRYPKDQKTLILSLTKLPKDIKLILVGEGPLITESKDLVATLGLQKRVEFLGIRSDIPALLKTADIVILSSAYEGMSLSSIEGMASQPFISSDVPGLRDVVRDYGLLFKYGDFDDLARNVLLLYSDRDLYYKVKARCLQRAKQFDIALMVTKHVELYSDLMSK